MKDLREKYIENAEKYAEAFKAIFEDNVVGNEYKSYNRLEKAASKKCHEIFEILRSSNNLSEIEDFMEHKNPYVRYLAASHGLFHNSKLAEEVLENLIESQDHKIQMHALSGLKAWRKIPWTEDRYK